MVGRNISKLLLAVTFCSVVASPVFAVVPGEFQPNYDKGFDVGYPLGYKSGLGDGKQRGRTEGETNGKTDGHQVGWNETYQPAHDHGYDFQFPVGHKEGWNVGLSDGFDKGFAWADEIAKRVDEGESAGLEIWNGGFSGAYGSITMFVNNYRDSTTFGTLAEGGGLGSIDWAAFYYQTGYDDGKGQGFSTGSKDGYNLTYPATYAHFYRVGYLSGRKEGDTIGFSDGMRDGYNDGWSQGHSIGEDLGFDAGANYRFFGAFGTPKYSLSYTRLTTGAIPEPASVTLAGIAAVLLVGWRRRQ